MLAQLLPHSFEVRSTNRQCRQVVAALLLVGSAVSGCATVAPQSSGPTRVTLSAPTTIPFLLMGNIPIVDAKVNGRQWGKLLVDSGASITMLKPGFVANHLGLSVPPDAKRVSVAIPGGQSLTIPILKISSLQVGGALAENLEVGVLDFFPELPFISGALGGDFLHHFRVTMDKQAGTMRLEPLH